MASGATTWKQDVENLADVDVRINQRRRTMTVNLRHYVLASAGLLGLALAMITEAATHKVEVRDFTFTPAILGISMGDSVSWTNAANNEHDTTSGIPPTGDLWESQLSRRATFTFTFNNPGFYPYTCAQHADRNQTGSVTVVSGPLPRPTVEITNPISGAVFTAPASFAVSATAMAGLGGVASVQFFRGASAFGTDTTAPYSINLNNIPAGNYLFTAVARDSFGNTTTSAPVNVTVVAAAVTTNVTIQGFAFNRQTITIAAGSTVIWRNMDTDAHTVAGVEGSPEALCGPGVILDSTAACTNRFMTPGLYPYFCSIHPEMRGTVVVMRASSTPMVHLTRPSTGAVLVMGTPVTLEAVATDADGIANVLFFEGTTLLGTTMNASHSFALSNLTAGSFSFRARAFDTLGFGAVSEPVSVSVIAPSPIQLFGTGFNQEGLFRFSHTADSGLAYVIEGTQDSDGFIPFVSLQTNVASTNVVVFTDPEPRRSRAYRVRLSP